MEDNDILTDYERIKRLQGAALIEVKVRDKHEINLKFSNGLILTLGTLGENQWNLNTHYKTKALFYKEGSLVSIKTGHFKGKVGMVSKVCGGENEYDYLVTFTSTEGNIHEPFDENELQTMSVHSVDSEGSCNLGCC